MGYLDSFGINNALFSAGHAVGWIGQQWDRNIDDCDYAAESVEPSRVPCDAFTGAREKPADLFDPYNSLAAGDVPGSPMKRGSMYHKVTLALNEPTRETSEKGWGNDVDIPTRGQASPIRLRSELSKYKAIGGDDVPSSPSLKSIKSKTSKVGGSKLTARS
jgi:hypothetical protein